MQDAHSPSVREIVHQLNAWADFRLQASYDNSGLLVGDPERKVTRALLALDCTEALIAEASVKGAQCVIVHHPIIFKGLKRLTGKNAVERTVMAALKAEVAIIAIHTNLDHVISGVNRKLAMTVGCVPESLRILQPLRGELLHLTVYTPNTHADAVEEAMFAAGGGQVGRYDSCAFRIEGEGSFRPLPGSNPHSGQSGERTVAHERRTELVVSRWHLEAVLSAMKAAHPYEEVAHQVVSLENLHGEVGAGMIGELAKPTSEAEFLDALKTQLPAPVIRHTKLLNRQVRKVAVCGGSGSFLLEDAIVAGADVFVTADFKYHEFQGADDRIVVADVGHYESEWRTAELIEEHLKEHFNEKFPNFAVHLAQENHNPVHYR